jgi:NMD protein affecting ribosome stability and mRNA decay
MSFIVRPKPRSKRSESKSRMLLCLHCHRTEATRLVVVRQEGKIKLCASCAEQWVLSRWRIATMTALRRGKMARVRIVVDGKRLITSQVLLGSWERVYYAQEK